MAGTLNDFLGSFSTDVARPARFDVSIPVPVALGVYLGTGKNLTFRCESAQIPGRTFETAIKKMGSAPIEKFPYHTNYSEITLDFIVSDDMSEKIFFDAWMELINPTTDYNFQYKSNYAVDLSINQYDVQNKLTYVAGIVEAFPIDVNQLDVSWSQMDSMHRLSVVFAYKQWQNNKVSAISQQIKSTALTGIINDITS